MPVNTRHIRNGAHIRARRSPAMALPEGLREGSHVIVDRSEVQGPSPCSRETSRPRWGQLLRLNEGGEAASPIRDESQGSLTSALGQGSRAFTKAATIAHGPRPEHGDRAVKGLVAIREPQHAAEHAVVPDRHSGGSVHEASNHYPPVPRSGQTACALGE